MEKMFKTKYKIVMELKIRATLDTTEIWALIKEILNKEGFIHVADFSGTIQGLQENREDVNMENEIAKAIGKETMRITRRIIATTILDNLKFRV